jgi:hypothetical protein
VKSSYKSKNRKIKEKITFMVINSLFVVTLFLRIVGFKMGFDLFWLFEFTHFKTAYVLQHKIDKIR